MIRSKVDFPQPDGPMSEMNSPCSTSRSMSWSAVVPPLNCFETPLIETAFMRRVPERDGRRVSRRPQILRLDRVVLREIEDRASETAGDRRRRLPDDGADDARRRGYAQRREE